MKITGTQIISVTVVDETKINGSGDGFHIIAEDGSSAVTVVFESPIDLWHFAKKIEAQAMKAMTPTEVVNA